MDPNSLQYLPGMIFVEEMRSEVPPESPFAAYDVLTPDEPGPVWRLAERLFHVARNGLASPQGESQQHAPTTSSLPLTNQAAESR
jgi:hypothetical protein